MLKLCAEEQSLNNMFCRITFSDPALQDISMTALVRSLPVKISTGVSSVAEWIIPAGLTDQVGETSLQVTVSSKMTNIKTIFDSIKHAKGDVADQYDDLLCDITFDAFNSSKIEKLCSVVLKRAWVSALDSIEFSPNEVGSVLANVVISYNEVDLEI